MNSKSPRPRALAVISDLPWPPRSGNHWRYLQNLRLLAEFGYEVGVVAGHVRDDVAEAGLGEHGRRLAVVRVCKESPSASARSRRMVSLGAALVAKDPPNPWAREHRSAGFDRAVLRAVHQFAPDAVLLRSTFSHLAPHMRPLTARLVIDAHDSDALFARTLQSTAAAWQRPGLRLRHLAAVRAERSLRHADELWVPAPREVEYFSARHSGLRTLLVPNGVPVPAVPPRRHPDGRTLLLFGAFGLPMNLAAADRLMDHVLPAVRDQVPDCRVELVGGGLPVARLERWRELPVEWLGRVEELKSHLARAQAFVFIPPSSFGSGTPLKVSEALGAAIPVVTTPVIARELGLVSGRNAVVADDPRELADGIVRLLRDPRAAAIIADAGHQRALEFLSFDSVLARARRDSVLAHAVT